MFLPVCRRAFLSGLRHAVFAGILAGLASGVACRAASGAPDYLIDVWDTEHDLPSSSVTAIAQTPEGYLWVGTYNGLARFDGVRFVVFDPLNTPELTHARIQGLYVDVSGTLWINTYRGGLASCRDGKFQREWPDRPGFDLHTTLVTSTSNSAVFVTQHGDVLTRTLSGGKVQWTELSPPGGGRPGFHCVDREGTLWFVTREGRVQVLKDGEFQMLPDNGGLGDKRAYTLVTDAQDRVWVGAENEIACWNGTRFESMMPANGDARFDARVLVPTRDGSMWVLAGDRLRKLAGRRWTAEATEWRGLLGWASGRAMGVHEDRVGGLWFNHYGNGLFHITPDGHFQRLTAKDGLPSDRVGAWFQGRDGSMWVGVHRGGLARLRDRRFHVVDPSEGLFSRTVFSVCEDGEGTVWFGTSGGGLCRWNDGKLTHFKLGGAVSANFVFSMAPRPGGGLWLSAAEGEDFFEFNGTEVQRAGWEVHGIKSILTDRTGRVWLGTKANLSWWTPDRRRTLGVSDGLSVSAIRALAEAPDGAIWGGADDGTLYRCEPERVQAFRPDDAMAVQPIWALSVDRDGVVWAGTFRGGLLRFKNGKFSRFTSKEGLPADIVSQVLEDHQGRLWLGTHKGICRVAKASLDACAEGKAKTVDCVTYGRLDGLPTLECSEGYQPACWRGNDGRLWFATTKGVVSVNPDELTAGSLQPSVVIEELRVDGQPVALTGEKLLVPPGHKQFEFSFTALTFGAPDKTRFRYRMEGLDRDWVEVEADKRRTAHFGHLQPRDYRFHVIACNSDGVWNDTGATLAFTVQPHFYERAWFLALMAAGILGVVVMIVRMLSARKYQRVLAQLEQQHAIERDRTRIAKDIHDDLGAGLTQITLLSELARREPAQAGQHLDRISDSARQLTRRMDEIVWAVDPGHDTFSGLMDYISAFAEDYLRVAGIRCRMDLPTALPEMRVDAEMRYNLFLALKEALNNIVKHARATEVWLRLQIEEGAFTLVVEDNGQGLSASDAPVTSVGRDRIASGSGLSNLGKRLADVGGRCVVQSTPQRGTRVEMTLAINGGASPRTSPVVGIGRNGGDH